MNKNSLLAIVTIFMIAACDNPTPVTTYQRQAGESCDDINNCDSDYICSGGLCRVMCQNDNGCTKKEHCKDNVCVPNPGDACRDGWSGGNCDTCADDYYGPNCQKCPECGKHGECRATLKGDGTCQCAEGWAGTLCTDCATDRYGSECQECPICGEHGQCNAGLKNDGKCLCDDGFDGELCNDCTTDHYGPTCAACECGEHGRCEPGINSDGHCSCDQGFTGPHCDKCSDPLKTGPNCDQCQDGRFRGQKCDECIDGATDSMLDNAGNSYKTICFDKQFWMAEPMNYDFGTNYHVGSSAANDATYGLLYDWTTAREICPAGWYLPEVEEYEALAAYLQNNNKSMTIKGSTTCTNGAFCLPAGGIYQSADSSYPGVDEETYLWTNSGKECSAPNSSCAQAFKVTKYEARAVSDDLYSRQNNGASVLCAMDSCTDSSLTGKDCKQCRDLRQIYNESLQACECKAPLDGTVNDIECNNYRTVKINGSTWMAENLKTTTDRSGNPVNCYANTKKDPNFVKNYGCLYVWDELATVDGTTDPKNVDRICPPGWRLPTQEDFDKLLTYVGNNKKDSSTSNFLALIARSTAWTNYSNQGLDEFGFGALPAGYYDSGYYYSFGKYGYWCSATEYDSSYAYYLYLGNGRADVINTYNKTYGFSVRCLKDEG